MLLLALVLGKRRSGGSFLTQQSVELAEEEMHPVVIRGGLGQRGHAGEGLAVTPLPEQQLAQPPQIGT